MKADVGDLLLFTMQWLFQFYSKIDIFEDIRY